jgi:hypothetical protein
MTKKGDPSIDKEAAMRRDVPATAAACVAVETPLFRVSSHVASKMTTRQAERINERELLSIYALLAYVSHNQNIRQETVQLIIEAEFGVDHVSKIRREDYERAIEFLVDLKIEEVMN